VGDTSHTDFIEVAGDNHKRVVEFFKTIRDSVVKDFKRVLSCSLGCLTTTLVYINRDAQNLPISWELISLTVMLPDL
jgi:hypothetical protein